MFKKYVAALKKVTELENKRDKLKADIKAATDEATVRSLGDTLEKVLEELQTAKENLAKVEKDAEGQGEQGGQGAAGGEERNANPMHDFKQRAAYKTTGATQSTDPSDSVEYRTAFMNFVCRGQAIPTELRENLTTTTEDAGAVIPTTIVNELVKNLESYGEIYSRVRHLNVQGGVKIPVLDLKPTAQWIDETTAAWSLLFRIQENSGG